MGDNRPENRIFGRHVLETLTKNEGRRIRDAFGRTLEKGQFVFWTPYTAGMYGPIVAQILSFRGTRIYYKYVRLDVRTYKVRESFTERGDRLCIIGEELVPDKFREALQAS